MQYHLLQWDGHFLFVFYCYDTQAQRVLNLIQRHVEVFVPTWHYDT